VTMGRGAWSIRRFIPVGRAIGFGRKALTRYVRQLVGARPPGHVTPPGSEYWRAAIEEAGVELLEVMKVTGHSRAVLLVRHPRFGKSVLKVACPACYPKLGYSNLTVARMVDHSNPGIFPALHAATHSYTLEAFVEGSDFREWMAVAYDPDVIIRFFKLLSLWSEECAGDAANRFMSPAEIRFLCDQYINKCLGHARYSTNADFLRGVGLIRSTRQELNRKGAWLDRAAQSLRLPRGMICRDLGVVNVVVESSSGGLYNIDYESLVPGHRGFAAAYFISSIFKLDLSEEKRTQIIDRLLTDEYLGGEAETEYFRTLTGLLVDIGRMIYLPEAVRGSYGKARPLQGR
jgi:hypothetical protein